MASPVDPDDDDDRSLVLEGAEDDDDDSCFRKETLESTEPVHDHIPSWKGATTEPLEKASSALGETRNDKAGEPSSLFCQDDGNPRKRQRCEKVEQAENKRYASDNDVTSGEQENDHRVSPVGPTTPSNATPSFPPAEASKRAAPKIPPTTSQAPEKRRGRRVHRSALQFVLKTVREESKRTVSLTAEKLTQEGKREDAKRLRLNAHHHVKEILSRVRRRMADMAVPYDQYSKLEDSCTADDLEYVNENRRREIQANKAMTESLQKELHLERRAYHTAVAKRNQLRRQLDSMKLSQQGAKLHTLVAEARRLTGGGKNFIEGESKVGTHNGEGRERTAAKMEESSKNDILVAPARPGVLRNLLEAADGASGSLKQDDCRG